MSRPFSANRSAASEVPSSSGQATASPVPDPAERLLRLAALVAVGEVPLPDDLEPVELSHVLAEVARLRRERLVRVVARAITLDLQRSRE